MAYQSETTFQNKLFRLSWIIVWALFARPLPRRIGRRWKNFILRLYGAKIHPSACVYSSAKIEYPPNLIMEADSFIGPDTDIYSDDIITIGEGAIISQRAFLCASSHDINDPSHRLITAPIYIEKKAWVASEAFVGMGVTIGEGAVVGARASVYKDVEPWTVVGGNPAKVISHRDKSKFE